MELHGIHHITCITGDAPANVDFYTRVLGLRLVKRSVNQDDPTVYHLFYADENGSAGSDLTFFEYPGAAPGRAGDGMVYRITWRVSTREALDFWRDRLEAEGVPAETEDGRLRFADPEGLGLELAVVATEDPPLIAEHPEIPAELALQGFDGVRAYASSPEHSRELLETTLGFRDTGDGWEVRGSRRGGLFAYDTPPAESGIPGAGTVHHIAWASEVEEHADWRARVAAGGGRVTPIIDRYYFKAIYFREPSGVLFEISTLGPGFAVDEPAESMGDHLVLPPRFEPLREKLEQVLTPLPEPRPWRARTG